MSTPYLGQIQPFPFNFAPKGWLLCNGQLLSINQYQALFSLLGTFYGGNGVSTFALPNLQGRASIGFGNGFTQGQVGGEDAHTLLTGEIPTHTHTAGASSASPTAFSPIGNYPGTITNAFASASPSPSVPLGPGSSANSGGQPHENRQPFLTLNFCIAISGIFPSRN